MAAGEETADGKESTELTESSNWERVVELVKTALREGILAEEATWKAVVLIPKGESNTVTLSLWM